MDSKEIITKVKALNLPFGSYVVFGSGPLAAVGIRDANDVDLYVTPAILQTFKEQGWQQVQKGPGDEPYTHDVYEAHDNWDFSPYSPTLEHLLNTAMIIDGVPFASLEEVRKWKLGSGGAKHLRDAELIDDYLSVATS